MKGAVFGRIFPQLSKAEKGHAVTPTTLLKWFAVLFIVTTAVGTSSPPLDAQGTLDRIKRAAEEAARQAKERQKQQPPQQTPKTADPAKPAGAPSPSVSTDDVLATGPTGPVIVDPKVMPDILGIRLGMPAREAEAALRAQYSKGTYRAWAYPLPPIPEQLTLGFTMNVDAVGVAGNDKGSVEITAPPNPQVVWRVSRGTNAMHVNRATLLASLREKYGKETLALQNGGAPAANDGQIYTLYWLIDERGQRAAPPRPLTSLQSCEISFPRGASPDMELFHGERTIDGQLQDPWARSSCIGTIVNIQAWEGRDPQIIELMYATVVDIPLYLRSGAATGAWWKAAAERARQQELEKTKQNKPKL